MTTKQAASGRPATAGDGVEARVVATVARVMAVPEEEVTVETRFVEDLGADSLRIMELVLELQEDFSIEIPDEALREIASVGDAVACVQRRLIG